MNTIFFQLHNLSQRISNRMLRNLFPDKSKVQFVEELNSSSVSTPFLFRPPSFADAVKIFIDPLYWGPESYTRGKWQLERGDLAEFITVAWDHLDKSYARYVNHLQHRKGIRHYLKQRIFTRYFTRQVKSHYEIDPEIYACFLDEEMVYTCALFEGEHDLEKAQENKYKTIVERLSLTCAKPKILNIGCGWGSFERFFVRHNDAVEVTGVSISKSQIDWATKRNTTKLSSEQSGRISLLLEDYLEHMQESYYDSVVAIGMVEHVGLSGYNEFFRKAHAFLKPGGRILVHMIISPESNVPTNKWLDKYIFPGGYAPSIKEIVESAEPFEFLVKGVYVHSPENYKKTLFAWRKKLVQNRDMVKDIYKRKHKYTEDQAEYLFRQWEFYLASSEARFSVRNKPLQVAHFVFDKV